MSEIRASFVIRHPTDQALSLLLQVARNHSVIKLTDAHKGEIMDWTCNISFADAVVGELSLRSTRGAFEGIEDCISSEIEECDRADFIRELGAYDSVLYLTFFSSSIPKDVDPLVAFAGEMIHALNAEKIEAELALLVPPKELSRDELYTMISGRLSLRSAILLNGICILGCIATPVLLAWRLLLRSVRR